MGNFEHPYPAMAGVTKEKVSYKRADGVNITATVYLPAGYDKEKDGRFGPTQENILQLQMLLR